MCPSSGLWGGVLDCDSQFTILSPPSFDGPQLWRLSVDRLNSNDDDCFYYFQK